MDKIKVFKVTLPPTSEAQAKGVRQKEILLPFEAISHFTAREAGNPGSAYDIHIKKNYFSNMDGIESISSGFVPAEMIEVLG